MCLILFREDFSRREAGYAAQQYRQLSAARGETPRQTAIPCSLSGVWLAIKPACPGLVPLLAASRLWLWPTELRRTACTVVGPILCVKDRYVRRKPPARHAAGAIRRPVLPLHSEAGIRQPVERIECAFTYSSLCVQRRPEPRCFNRSAVKGSLLVLQGMASLMHPEVHSQLGRSDLVPMMAPSAGATAPPLLVPCVPPPLLPGHCGTNTHTDSSGT